MFFVLAAIIVAGLGGYLLYLDARRKRARGADDAELYGGELSTLVILRAKFQSEEPAILALKQHFCDTKNPLVLINIDKKELVERSWRRLLKFSEHFKILIFF